jgi:carboxypeptidase Taq
MGQHESVSRFYENLIGRSEAFVNLVYDKAKEIFPEVLSDVTARELYEAVNIVEPSLIRTEADEFTYVFHIIIRYEIEKMIMEGKVKTEDLPKLWNDMYEKYLGIRPGSDREGILQDVHWTGGFGYFPTYALGNFYNAMYYNEMNKAFSVDEAVAAGDFDRINGWMRDHVFAKADRLEPALWIRDITGRDLTPDDFLDYLEKKYIKLYEL